MKSLVIFGIVFGIGSFIFSFYTLALSEAEGLNFAFGATMSGDNYTIQSGKITSGGGSTTNSQYNLRWNLDQTIGSKLENISTQSGTLGFSLSESLIDFGSLSPTNPVQRTSVLTITSSKESGYSVIAYQDGPLTSSQSPTPIPDTTCDDGFCNEARSSQWVNLLTYGFGYRCDNLLGTPCLSDFTDPAFYKQFADNAKKEQPQEVIRETKTSGTNQAQITVKVNISLNQPPGRYGNTITYILTPTL
ncbi:MAG: hypothetical protein A2698_00010 [Candidatus Levybacteria bacterium RIFCSPHIGHO2_01_FULL_42_15]|nr:MAG: hypothetical protein A2698_00010 [Candidatus Levybacteria bacterium RIFCSPHIGHO2_01_FULL_42_15]